MWFNGLLDLSVWQLIAVTLVLTHITIVSVTLYLHRHSAHNAWICIRCSSTFFASGCG